VINPRAGAFFYAWGFRQRLSEVVLLIFKDQGGPALGLTGPG
jgi:hypothetical protein